MSVKHDWVFCPVRGPQQLRDENVAAVVNSEGWEHDASSNIIKARNNWADCVRLHAVCSPLLMLSMYVCHRHMPPEAKNSLCRYLHEPEVVGSNCFTAYASTAHQSCKAAYQPNALVSLTACHSAIYLCYMQGAVQVVRKQSAVPSATGLHHLQSLSE